MAKLLILRLPNDGDLTFLPPPWQRSCRLSALLDNEYGEILRRIENQTVRTTSYLASHRAALTHLTTRLTNVINTSDKPVLYTRADGATVTTLLTTSTIAKETWHSLYILVQKVGHGFVSTDASD